MSDDYDYANSKKELRQRMDQQVSLDPESDLSTVINAYAARLNKLPTGIDQPRIDGWGEILACTSKEWCLAAIKHFCDTHPIGTKIKAQQWEQKNKRSILTIGTNPVKKEAKAKPVIEKPDMDTIKRGLEKMKKAMGKK